MGEAPTQHTFPWVTSSSWMGSPWLAVASRMACIFSFSKFSCCWFHLPQRVCVCACLGAHMCSRSGVGAEPTEADLILRGQRGLRTLYPWGPLHPGQPLSPVSELAPLKGSDSTTPPDPGSAASPSGAHLEQREAAKSPH